MSSTGGVRKVMLGAPDGGCGHFLVIKNLHLIAADRQNRKVAINVMSSKKN